MKYLCILRLGNQIKFWGFKNQFCCWFNRKYEGIYFTGSLVLSWICILTPFDFNLNLILKHQLKTGLNIQSKLNRINSCENNQNVVNNETCTN